MHLFAGVDSTHQCAAMHSAARMLHGETLVGVSVDWQKAHDSIPRRLTFEVLHALGLDNKILDAWSGLEPSSKPPEPYDSDIYSRG